VVVSGIGLVEMLVWLEGEAVVFLLQRVLCISKQQTYDSPARPICLDGIRALMAMSSPPMARRLMRCRCGEVQRKF